MSGRILLVEDDVALATLYQRMLASQGFEVFVASTGSAGLECASRARFDAIVSDIAMPEMDGVQFVERLRKTDPIVPVLFLTGQAEVETVQRAIELHAFRYLIKPVNLRALVASVRRAASCCRWVRARKEATASCSSLPPNEGEPSDWEVTFGEALGLLRVYYQPVVDTVTRQLRGFRAVARCLHPLLPSFDELRVVANRLGRRHELRQRLWTATSAPLGLLDEQLPLFVWTDVEGLTAVHDHSALGKRAERTVLMVSDREGIGEQMDAQVLASLRKAGYRLGVDQLGDGYAGLNSLAWLEPEFLELDAALVRNVAKDFEQRQVVGALAALAKELGAQLIAEGVTDERDAQALGAIGCDLLSWDRVAPPDDLAPFSAETLAELRAHPNLALVRGPLSAG